MSFFGSIPAPAPEPSHRRPRPFWERSEVVIPGSVPADLVLVRTDRAAVAVGSVRAYPNGFQFTVHTRLRTEDETNGPFMGDPFERHWRGRAAPDDGLRLGILYADGRRAATTGGPAPHAREPGDLILQQGGGGGSSLSYETDFWVHPLPPDGPVTLVVSWLARGITEARADVDGAAIRQAARRAITLWPEEPEPESGETI